MSVEKRIAKKENPLKLKLSFGFRGLLVPGTGIKVL
jgi:hypothetical protein